MNFTKIVSDVKTWESKISEKYPLKIFLAFCIVVILCWLGGVRSDVSSIKRDVSWIESDVSSIKSDVSSIESDVSSIKRRLPY